MHLFYTPNIATSLELPEEEAAHALRVLRLSTGDRVMLTDGAGRFFSAEVTDCTGKRCFVHILDTLTPAPLWHGHLHLALAPTKNMDRLEWLVEKATEIGLDELSLLDCRYSERHVVKTERLDKILVSAMKQSLKAVKPILHGMMSFEQFVQQPFSCQCFIAHCYSEEEVAAGGEDEANRSLSYCATPFRQPLREALDPDADVLVLIGPEGDFSLEEVRMALALGYQSVSLGNSRLRTETAALVAVHLMNLTHT